MTDESIDEETSGQNGESSKSPRGRAWRSYRRKRPLYKRIKRRLNEVLKIRRIVRALFLPLLLIGFAQISIKNGVLLDTNGEASLLSTHQNNSVSRSSLPESEESDIESSKIAVARSKLLVEQKIDTHDEELLAAKIQLSSAWPTQDPGLSTSNYEVSAQNSNPSREIKSPISTLETKRERSMISTTYVVNEGGSLWRTGRRFIDDAVVLDKLIDNLASNGMDVRKVRAGLEFIVNDLGSRGRIVIVNDGTDSYESHIHDGKVVTSRQRQADNASRVNQPG
ncbi:MAG: hypothetical protein KTR32_41180 [Granulosicoccus sp.]|nr:hypothetical protein [Granulosicoccus sp.]